MKLLLGTCAALLIACGGGAKKSTTEQTTMPKQPACAAATEHVGDLLTAEGAASAEARGTVVRVMTERCETDRWSADAVACITTAEDADALEACSKILTEEQRRATEEQVDRELGGDKEDRQMETGAPPPTDDAEGGSGGGKGKAPDDPCGGGA